MASGRVAADANTLVQECAAGLLPVRVDGGNNQRIVHVQAPQATQMPLDQTDIDALGRALGASFARAPTDVCNGPHWLTCDLGEGTAVRGLRPDMGALAALTERLGAVGACAFGHEHDGSAAMAVRAFCPADGIPEDPVTGSANAAIAHYLHVNGGLERYGHRYRASQGREIGRNGVVEVGIDADGRIEIGGACTIVVEGALGVD
jgi:PhzF family phenazine biosynthesis protein